MKSAYNFLTLLVLLMSMTVGTTLQASVTPDEDKQEFSKSIKKDFSITPSGTVSLYNKYGKMDIKTWDKDRVKIDIRITVNAASESAAQDVFDRISVDFSNSSDYVKAETQIGSTKSSWWGSWGGDNNSDFNIDYDVYMPPGATLDLSNKYGDVYVSELTGDASVTVKYGNFRLEGVKEKLEVHLGYGTGTVVKAGNTDATVSYSKFRLQESEYINFSTKYSKIAVDEAGNIRASSAYDTYDIGKAKDIQSSGKYDNYSIGAAQSISAASKYSDFSVGTLKESGNFDLTYGGARIGKVSRGFSEMRILGRYADFKIKVEEGASYVLDADADYAGIRYPSALQVNYEKDQGTSHQVEGYMATKGARSIIKARLDYGGLKVD